ncbi:hypothetical protein SLA2020_124480 [Shorea laevis]
MCLQDWLRTDLKGFLDDICLFTQNEDVDCDEDNNSKKHKQLHSILPVRDDSMWGSLRTEAAPPVAF